MTNTLRAGPPPITLRPLTAEDLPAAQRLTAAMRWPHRQEDWAFLLRTGEGLAAERDGRLVGTAMGWRFGAEFARIGMLLADPPRYDTALARLLMEAMMARLGRRGILLNGTPAGMPLYEALGFARTGIVRQYQGASFSIGLVPLPPGHRLRPVGQRDHALLAALDASASGLPRQALIAALLEGAKGVALDHAGEVAGFALMRRFGQGQVIGPVVAPGPEMAKALIGHWLGVQQGQFVRVDVPAESGLPAWLEALGLDDAGTVTGMALGRPPAPRGAPRGYALVSQTLG
ncbi:GNAT family N-acetyltransferase [Pseudoroseomonas rhizosphaerae]|uniref:GNAT family N-acetyltransferase n=1 Tax=Teichococcus rhizosphaerae TaxID=1335062 RepID=A0A2C7AAX4_9PROT|nr:GNAT family N-acetyltransferase [Pseudoroseomonas rhizosphaerae]PHK95209.1 GNAT family N-acetyltransferase [Pseudoroseomonas rhizosphaerae]